MIKEVICHTWLCVDWNAVSAIATIMGTFGALLAAYLVYRDLKATTEVAIGQNSMQLISFLQAEDVRKARRIIIKKLKGKQYSKWSKKEKQAADKVTSTYDIAALLVEKGMVDSDIFVENYGPSVQHCFPILKQHIEARQLESGPHYWNDFSILYERAKKRAPLSEDTIE